MDAALLAGDYAPGAAVRTPAGEKAYRPFELRVNAVVRRSGLYLGRQAGVILIAGAAGHDFVCVDHGIEVRGEREYLGLVCPVIMGEAVPPFHAIALGLVPGRQPHEGQIRKSAVPVYVHQRDFHAPTPQPWAISWLTWEA